MEPIDTNTVYYFLTLYLFFIFFKNVQNVVFELSWSNSRFSSSPNKKAFVGWTGMSTQSSHTNESTLEIDPAFAQSLELENKKKVSIKVHVNAPVAHTVHLEPVSSSDWEIVELHAQFLEGRMLNQVRAVSTLHDILVYPSPTAVAKLKVLKIEPPLPEDSPQFARLDNNTEVVIAPKLRKKTKSDRRATSVAKSAGGSSSRRKRAAEPAGPTILLRGIALPHVRYDDIPATHQYEIYVSPESVFLLQQAKHVNVSVIKPKGLQKDSSKQQQADPGFAVDDSSGNTIVASTKIVAKLVEYSDSLPDFVGLSYSLAEALGVQQSVGNIIRIEVAQKPLINPPSTLLIHKFSTTSTPASESSSSLKLGKSQSKAAVEKLQSQEQEKANLVNSIKAKLKETGILLGPITNKMILPPLPGLLDQGALIELKKTEGWMLCDGNVQLEIDSTLIRPESSIGPTLESLISPEETTEKNVVGIDKILNSINSTIRAGNSFGGLLYGSRGSGKTAVLESIKKGLHDDCIYSLWVSCGHKSEDPLQAVKEELNKIFLQASWYSPSVVFLDDLDKLIPAEVEHADSTRTKQLAEVFQQLASSIMESRPVTILASCQAQESINSHLITSHIFEETFHLKSPDKDVRHAILLEAVAKLNMSLDDFDILEIAGSTEGYQPGDLWTLVERAKHQVIIRTVENFSESLNGECGIIQQVDFETALKDFVPSSLRGVKLQKSSVSWKEIGGLKETKKVLLETLEWPTRYAPIFSKCPLRLRSGLLLYGYPGCGKTLLASAVASESGLNFISIKGPEILNKYIGASEQSVRELFERAQAAKPCILFFDEFDSIAPKRGHDSTGVTDRVVNQMLTQMDGAEGLDGVYVLAATSRPDLIDSALLRPGRLDKSLICDMPNLEDRMDILQAVQGTMKISPEVDLLQDVAMKTEGYSGADLQAVLYNAYLDAIHDVVDLDESKEEDDTDQAQAGIDNDEVDFFQVELSNKQKSVTSNRSKLAERAKMSKKLEALLHHDFVNASTAAAGENDTTTNNDLTEASGGNDNNNQVLIRPHHIIKSLEDTQPSISYKERVKLQGIYDKFVSGRSGDMPDGTASNEIGGRTTLM